jgi:hypothetical protein
MDLVESGRITEEEAYRQANNKLLFEKHKDIE